MTRNDMIEKLALASAAIASLRFGTMDEDAALDDAEHVVSSVSAALRAALGTCGTCARADDKPLGLTKHVRCDYYGALRDVDDGCIKHYEPKEPTR